MNSGGDHIGHFLLPAGTFGGVVHHSRHLPHRRAQSVAGGQHFANHVALAVQEPIKAPGQIAQLIGASGI
ncbi:hypothetical protein D3C71_2184100 [compost metagenome]